MHAHRALQATAILVFALATIARAAEFANTTKYSSSFHPDAVDTNGDGEAAVIANGSGLIVSGDLAGQALVFESVGEYVNASPTDDCPLPKIARAIVAGSGVSRDPDGHALFSRFESGLLCIDASAGKAKATYSGTFVGGTGKWKGATGTFTSTAKVTFLTCDSSNRCFGGQNGKIVATIVTP